MHFAGVDAAGEPPAHRARHEDESAEEKSIKARLRSSWPQLNVSNDKEGPIIMPTELRSLMYLHDRAHENCLHEHWTVRSRFGAHNRFGLSVTFSSDAVVSDVDPPHEDSLLTHVCVVNWSITDHEKRKFYRFSSSDERAPQLFSMLIAKRSLRDQPAMLQATLEQLNSERLVLPDQLMDDTASTRLTELDVVYGKNTLKSNTPPLSSRAEVRMPTYTLHLEGVSSEHEEADLAEEVKAVVDLTFVPRGIPPALDGVRGILSNGNWESDEFCYSIHHTRFLNGSLRVTRASDDLEIARDLDIKRGTVWMEHSFGGVVPRSVDEARFVHALYRRRIRESTDPVIHDRCLIRLYDTETYCLSLTRVMVGDSDVVKSCCATVQSAVTRQGYQYNSEVSLTDAIDGAFMSPDTGIVYPTRWSVTCPLPDGAHVELKLAATLPNQEIITTLAQPSLWDGTVTVMGKLVKKNGTSTEVSGDGFVASRGRGKLQTEKALFRMLHGIGVSSMERPEVATAGSCVEIADGPGLAAVAQLTVALQSQEFRLTSSQQVVLSALFGAYGYIFHHPHDEREVKKALEWCYNRWVTFFGASSVSYRTLTLRAFMLQELCDVMHAKCAAWIPKSAEALDIAVPINYLSNRDAADIGRFTLPARSFLSQPPSALEISQIKALMDGTWTMNPEETQGSMNAVLIEQGVGVLWRSVNNNAVPTWKISVNRAADMLFIDESTLLERCSFVIALNGTEWVWDSVSRGRVTSRSAILSSGRELYVETDVRGGVERAWYQFQDGGKTMVQTIFFFTTPTTATPVASCERHFKIQLPLGSPTNGK